MGAACSQVDRSNRSAQRRMSFSSIKRAGKGAAPVLKPGKEWLESYSIGEATGSDDKVVSATNNENEVEYVARSIERGEMPIQNINEVEDHLQVLTQLDHVHICRFVEAFDNSEIINMVYERAGNPIFEEEPDLKVGRPLSVELGQTYCRQLAMALSVAHKQGLVHGRLSDTSLLLDLGEPAEDEERSVKICDMGQSFILRPCRGKGLYEAPEVITADVQMPTSKAAFQKNLRQYAASDMWALGTLLYRMLTGRLPFPDGKAADVAVFGPEWEAMPDAREVVNNLLKLNGRIRMTADKVLRHP